MSAVVPLIYFIFHLSCFLATVNSLHLPPELQVHLCKRADPFLADCVNKSIHNLKPLLAKGIPELGVGALDPFHYAEASLSIDPRNVGVTGNELSALVKDIRCVKGTNFTVHDLKMDIENIDFEVDVEVHEVYCKAEYRIDVRVAKLPIKGYGPISGNITNVRTSLKVKGEIVTRENVRHLQFNQVQVKIVKLDSLEISMKNKYKGDTLLTEAFIKLISSKSTLFLQTFVPLLESAAADIFKTISNETNENLDFDEVFPA